jgi:hypothetical protein
MIRLKHWWLLISTIPLLIGSSAYRNLLTEMLSFCHQLPATFDIPILEALARLDEPLAQMRQSRDSRAELETHVRRLSDIAALLDRGSRLGLCLRRSLIRFHYLRRIGVPVVMQFGAKFRTGQLDRSVAGHAWLTLNGRPYFETGEDHQEFTVMFSFPPRSEAGQA